jgi:protein gp37
MTKSGIEWTDRSDWNPIRGCTRVSEGCRNCYAEAIAARFSDRGQPFHGFAERTANGPRWTGKVELIEDRLTLPLRWKKPAKIFVNSAFDLFHDSIPDEWIDRIFAVIALSPQHTFQVLTKRSKRMREYFGGLEPWSNRVLSIRAATAPFMSRAGNPTEAINFPLPNVWLGVTAENQKAADERLPYLLATTAAVRWVSVEPLLGPIDLMRIDHERDRGWEEPLNALKPYTLLEAEEEWGGDCKQTADRPALDWVVVGGESGPNARPMHPDWARSLRDQCEAAGVPFFFKQWGAYKIGELKQDAACIHWQDGSQEFYGEHQDIKYGDHWLDKDTNRLVIAYPSTKNVSGSLLDGREHKEFPEVRP